jgi:hypothetical protein
MFETDDEVIAVVRRVRRQIRRWLPKASLTS